MASKSSANSLADPVFLETIDKLFQHNIGEYVSLPQLLVVGDQSSGKSSVLEGLTGLPFPRDSALCTRFATHIAFRRTAHTEVSVSILPTANAHPDHAEKLKKYQKVLEDLDQPMFAEILQEVQSVMGLKETGASDSVLETFSDDVLKIEICGPGQEHYSVIDVPGIFRNTTEGLTTDSDIEVVRNMVNQYMKNPRSIILAVVPANVDVATQEILKMAEKCDTKGVRTLGVLTKPDLVDKGAENRVVDLIEGRSYRLKLGWSMVRNPGQSELNNPAINRHDLEKDFFKSIQPWARLEKDRVGVGSLRGQLRDLLTEMVKKEFPNVKSDIIKRLNERQKQLKLLGPCRETQQQQHEYLLTLATQFQSLVFNALTVRYGADSLFDRIPSLRLATAVVNRNHQFDEEVAKLGHTMSFNDKPSSSEQNRVENDDDSAEDSGGRLCTVRHTRTAADLDNILAHDSEVPMPKSSGILPWLEDVYKNTRGFDLGGFEASLVPVVWKKQSANWETLTLCYVSDIVSLVHNFIIDGISAICENKRVHAALMSVLMEGLIERYTKGIEYAKHIIFVEQNGTPMTTNIYFAETVEKCRQQRQKSSLAKHVINIDQHGDMVRLDDITQTPSGGNTEHAIRELHDTLQSYYTVARKRFVDAICMHAVDFHLVTGPFAPIKLFSPRFVSGLTETQLDRIAGEDISTRKKRERLRREIDNLTNGKKIFLEI